MGRAYVKLSGLNKRSVLPHPYPDAWPYVQALLDAYTPQSLMWASDWPFLRATERIDYGPLLKLFNAYCLTRTHVERYSGTPRSGCSGGRTRSVARV